MEGWTLGKKGDTCLNSLGISDYLCQDWFWIPVCKVQLCVALQAEESKSMWEACSGEQ